MTERFFIEFSDGAKIHPPFRLYYTINEHSLAKLWKKSIIENFIGENNVTNSRQLDKMFLNKGFCNSWDSEYSRNLSVICDELNYAISLVNEHMNPCGYQFIDLEFTIEKLKDPEIYRDIMNRIHHHFEVLIGQTWNPSEWFTKHANKTARWAIGQLNTCCHEIEAAVETINGHDFAFCGVSYNCDPWDGLPHPSKIVYNLELEHYEAYKNIHTEWGSITPYYSQLGKTPREAFNDGDDYIDDENITSPRFMTGEANLNFFTWAEPGSNKPLDTSPKEEEFKEWLKSNGRDYNDPTLAVGYAEIGKVDLTLYQETWLELDAKIRKYDNVTEVGFVDENFDIVVSQRYDYTWQEQYQAQLKMHGLNRND